MIGRVRALVLLVGVAAAVGILSACDPEPPPVPFVVTSTADLPDAAPGDGVCETITPGQCTLRAAVMEANAIEGNDAIELGDATTYTLSVAGRDEDAAATGDLDVVGDLAVSGRSTIDAAGLDRVFDVHSGTFVVTGATVRGGNNVVDGGGIRAASGVSVQLFTAEVRNNRATGGAGGVDAPGSGVLAVGSAVTQNVGGTAGGLRVGGELRATNVTVSGNQAATAGGAGGVSVTGATPAYVELTTVTANLGTVGGLAGPVELSASVVGSQGSGPDCAATVTSLGANADSDGSCLDGSGVGDLESVAVGLGPLGLNWGTTRNHLLLPQSPLRDAVPAGAAGCGTGLAAIDQRGGARPLDANDDGVTACDIGAVEVAGLTVTNSGDGFDSAPGDGMCQTGGPVGSCSLRAAVQEANSRPGADTITIPAGTPTIALTSTLNLPTPMTVNGNGTTISGTGAVSVLKVLGAVTLDHVTVTGGRAAAGGGIFVDLAGTATVRRSTITGNQSTGTNSCVSSYGMVIQCGPDGEGGGGAGIASLGVLHLDRSTVHGNHGQGAGCSDPFPGYTACRYVTGNGVRMRAGTVIGSTIADNIADPGDTGAGLHVSGASTTIERSTIAHNGAATTRNQIVADSAIPGGVVLRASIVDAASPLCSGITSGGWNVSKDPTCGSTPTDLAPFDPSLGPLADHGGPTLTMQPRTSSPAVDLIPAGTAGLCDAASASDQRGVGRPVGAGCDAGAVELQGDEITVPLTLTVNHGGDAVDAVPGDGACQDAGGVPGACSVRAAVDEANAWPATDTITFAAGVDPVLSRAGVDEDANQTGDLDVTDAVQFAGNGATIDGAGLDRVIQLRNVVGGLEDLTITGGSAAYAVPGAVYQQGGSVIVSRTTLTGNANQGYRRIGGNSVISNTTVSGNAGAGFGSAGLSGGMSLAGGATIVAASTVVDNTTPSTSAPAGIQLDQNQATSVTVIASIVANPGSDCSVFKPFASAGWNVVDDTSCSGLQPSDRTGVSPALGPLTDNGGPTPTHLPTGNSPALDLVPVGTFFACGAALPVDQRGMPRPLGAACDAGAVEGSSPVTYDPLALVVDHPGDGDDDDPGDGVCQDLGGPAGACSLRAAVQEANAWPTADEITIAPGVDPVLQPRSGGAQLGVADGLTIDGGGATVTGVAADYVVIQQQVPLTVVDLALVGGRGSIYANGPLALTRVEVRGTVGTTTTAVSINRAPATIRASTIAGNADDGLSVFGAESSLTAEDSTIAGNGGDGLRLYQSGPVTVRRSTLIGNQVSVRNVDSAAAATVSIGGSVLSDLAGTCAGNPLPVITSEGYNVGLHGACGTPSPTDQWLTDALLQPLADNGGSTRTALPAANSPALDTVPVGTVGLCDASAPVDQRGAPRPLGPACDAGAVEGAGPDPLLPVTVVVTHGGDAPDAAPGDGVCQDLGGPVGACSLRAAIGETDALPYRDTITFAPGVSTVTLSLAGRGDDANASGDLDIADDVIIEGGGVAVDAAGLDRAFDLHGGDVDLSALTVTGGHATDGVGANVDGGGILVRGGVVNVVDATIVANTTATDVAAWGGGIAVRGGSLAVGRSSIASNASVTGGGLAVLGSATASLTATTVGGNDASELAGGVYASASTQVTIVTSTISSNTAPSRPAFFVGTATVRRSTVAANVVGTGDPLTAAIGGLNLTVGGSVIANPGRECSSPISSGGYNRADDTTCGFTGVGDVRGVDPGIGVIGDHGGPTWTHLLLAGSNAVDAIPAGTAGLCDAATDTDQRGAAAPMGAGCDAGAVERQPTDP